MMILSFSEFIHKYSLQNRVTLNVKNQNIPSSLTLNDVEIFLRDGPINIGIVIISFHPKKEHITLDT